MVVELRDVVELLEPLGARKSGEVVELRGVVNLPRPLVMREVVELQGVVPPACCRRSETLNFLMLSYGMW